MSEREPRQFRLFGWAAAIAAVLQAISLIRYIGRMPEDWLGIAFNVITMIAFIIGSAGAFLRARQGDGR